MGMFSTVVRNRSSDSRSFWAYSARAFSVAASSAQRVRSMASVHCRASNSSSLRL